MKNNCYLNSGLQCLFNAYPKFIDYFINADYTMDINSNSKTKGNIVREFAKLCTEVREASSMKDHASPKQFKDDFIKFAPYFDNEEE